LLAVCASWQRRAGVQRHLAAKRCRRAAPQALTAMPGTSAPSSVASDLGPEAIHALRAQGFSDIVMRQGQICALKDFVFTTGLMVGLDPIGYRLRYCYEHAHEARAALAAWDGEGHPGGPWIKCKGAGVELLNPALRD
jgi:hypothetical protein